MLVTYCFCGLAWCNFALNCWSLWISRWKREALQSHLALRALVEIPIWAYLTNNAIIYRSCKQWDSVEMTQFIIWIFSAITLTIICVNMLHAMFRKKDPEYMVSPVVLRIAKVTRLFELIALTVATQIMIEAVF